MVATVTLQVQRVAHLRADRARKSGQRSKRRDVHVWGRRGTAMLWPHDTCPFGLPDAVDRGDAPVGDLLLTSIGHVLRATTADIVDAPLPLQLASLLRRLGRPQRPARGSSADRAVPRAARS